MFRRKVKTAPPPAPEPEQGEASLGSISRALWRNKRSIIAPTLIIAAAAFVASNLLTPKYRSEARVLIEGRENIFLRPEAEKAVIDRSAVDAETLTSQVQLILSRDLARDVIKQLGLSDLPEFDAAKRPPSPVTSLLSTVGLARDPQSLPLEERVLNAYYDRLSAYAVEKSRVMVIDFQSHDPELAAKITNAIAEKYLSLQQLARQDQARSASQWLSGEIEKLRLRVAEAEAKVEEFRTKSNLFVGANNTTLSNQQLTELNSQLSAARALKADAETKSRLIREQLRSGRPIESADVSNSELLRRLSEQRVTLRAQLAEQSSTLLAQHPRIKELRAQIGDLDQQLRSESEKLARQLENDSKVAGARVDTLSASLDALKRQAASNNEQDVQLRAFERDAKSQRDLLESYLAKFREANARDSIALAPPDARIISRAAASNVPHFPKKMPIVLIAALATFCLSSAFVITNALLQASPYHGPLRIDGAPVVYNLAPARSTSTRTRASDHLPPAPKLTESAPVRAAPVAAIPVATNDSVDTVAAALRQAGEAGRRVAVIGAARNVGTTLTAIALGRLLARNARVVVVDLAFASPNLEVISSDPSAPGIADLVRGAASFGDIITRDQGSRAHVISAGAAGEDGPEVIGSHMLAAALDALAQSYDHLVIDAGSQSDIALAPMVRLATRAVLVAGEAAGSAIAALREQMLAVGFTDVDVMTGAPPPLEQAPAGAAAA